MRQATTDDVLIILRDRQAELRAILNEPKAILSMPNDDPRLIATLPHQPVQDETMVIVDLDGDVVMVPTQLVSIEAPVQCGPWLEKQRELLNLTDTIRTNDMAMCLAVEIRRRQALEQAVLERDSKIGRMELLVGMLDERLHVLETQFDIFQDRYQAARAGR